MTNVNISTTPVTVQVTENDGVVVVASPSGPQGPQGPPGADGGVSTLAELTDVDVTGKVGGSVLVYDSSAAKFKADNLNTVLEITNGGNF